MYSSTKCPYMCKAIFGTIICMIFQESADIFFAITSAAIIIISALAAWAGVLVIRTLKDINKISQNARRESEKIVEDVNSLRNEIKREGTTILHFFRSIGMLLSRKKKKSLPKRRANKK